VYIKPPSGLFFLIVFDKFIDSLLPHLLQIGNPVRAKDIVKYFRNNIPKFLTVTKISERSTLRAVALIFFDITLSYRTGREPLFSAGATGTFAFFMGAAIRANYSAIGYFHQYCPFCQLISIVFKNTSPSEL
jgi:hypothetical protein